MYVFIFGKINGHNGYWVLHGAGVDFSKHTQSHQVDIRCRRIHIGKTSSITK